LNWFGAAVLVICGFMLAFGSRAARILASLSAFAADRGSNPGTFSLYLTVYAIALSRAQS